MPKAISGVVTIVQEGRFQMTADSGVSHLFILAHSAATEPQQLSALQAKQARVRVHYTPAANLIGNTVTAIELAG
jgi:hypothetical protein